MSFFDCVVLLFVQQHEQHMGLCASRTCHGCARVPVCLVVATAHCGEAIFRIRRHSIVVVVVALMALGTYASVKKVPAL